MYSLRSRYIVRFVIALVLAGAGVTAKILLSHHGSSSSSSPTNVSADQSLYKEGNFQKAIDAVKGKVGSGAGVLEVQVLPGQADFTLRNGERAYGYRYSAGDQSLAPIQITVTGSGSLKGQDFAFSDVSSSAMAKMAAGVAKDGNTPTTMTLRRRAVDGLVGWSITADGNGRTGIVYTADVNGGHFSNAEKSAASAASLASQAASAASQGASATTSSALANAQKLQQCIANANGDVNAIAQCSTQH